MCAPAVRVLTPQGVPKGEALRTERVNDMTHEELKAIAIRSAGLVGMDVVVGKLIDWTARAMWQELAMDIADGVVDMIMEHPELAIRSKEVSKNG